jgi:peptidoglycan/LPS O-acetylase OafA/YrhL
MGEQMKKSAPFTQIESVYLDVLRFALSALVVVAHISQPAFSSSLSVDVTEIAIGAVGGFFILSGYTISSIIKSESRFDARSFLVDRLTRLWSVAVPAMVITVLLDLFSMTINPHFYESHFSVKNAAGKVILNLAFGAQSWGRNASPMSNSPFWSLNYEAGFYVLYAAFAVAILKRSRWWLPLIAAAAIGPAILATFFLWCVPTFLFATAIFALEMQEPRNDMHSVRGLIKLVFDHFGIIIGRLSSDLVAGMMLFTMVNLLILPFVIDAKLPISLTIKTLARRLGALTFPLYLIHFPILVFLKASGIWPDKSVAADVLVFMSCVVLANALLGPTEAVKYRLRALWGKLVAQGTT